MRLPSCRCSWLAAPLLFACASAPRTVLVDGREVPRPTLDFSGQPYRIRHQRAYPNPGSPSSGLTDAGGDIHGQVCGMTVDYAVSHKGDHVLLEGSLDGPLPSAIEVREDGEARTFEGKLGGQTVTLALRADSLQGHVGRRLFELAPSEGDRLLGEMRDEGQVGAVPVEVNGLQALRDMPSADQAAVLPSLLTCGLGAGRYQALSSLVVGFGGRGSEAPPQSSSLYTHNR
jgi:hypothetical protein